VRSTSTRPGRSIPSGFRRTRNPGAASGDGLSRLRPSSDRLCFGRERPPSIAGVDGSGGFDQQDRRVFLGARAVLDATRNDEQFPLVEFDVAIGKLDRQVPFEDEEEVIGVVVLVPDELAFDLDDANIVVVDASDDLRLPVLIEEAQLLGQVDFVRDLLLLLGPSAKAGSLRRAAASSPAARCARRARRRVRRQRRPLRGRPGRPRRGSRG
jgi:hypothetical protein